MEPRRGYNLKIGTEGRVLLKDWDRGGYYLKSGAEERVLLKDWDRGEGIT